MTVEQGLQSAPAARVESSANVIPLFSPGSDPLPGLGVRKFPRAEFDREMKDPWKLPVLLAHIHRTLPGHPHFSFSVTELRAMNMLISLRAMKPNERIYGAKLGKEMGVGRSTISDTVWVLGSAGIVVNLGTAKIPDLAVNPFLGMWYLERVRTYRGARKGKSGRSNPYSRKARGLPFRGS